MRYVRLGGTGLSVSRIALGMMSFGDPQVQPWALTEDEAEPIVRHAVEAGVTFFDTADMYSDGASEQITGRLLSQLFASRDDYVLATKVYYPTRPGPNGGGLSRKHVLASIDASLTRLGTDYVDLYQVHRWDPGTPAEETMTVLHDIVRAGKARYIGASAMPAWRFGQAQHTADAGRLTRFVSMQNRYNLVNREEEREMIPLCQDQGVAVLPFSPLARGLLAGARQRGGIRLTARARGTGPDADRDADFDVAEAVHAVAAARGVPAATVAWGWLLSRPGVTAPVAGATQARHLDDAIAALDLTLTGDEVARLQAPYLPRLITSYS